MTEEMPAGNRSLFWLAYGQLAAMLGALSLLVLCTHLFEFELRGPVQAAFGFWTQTMRPLVAHLTLSLANLLPEGWRFELGDTMTDYLAVAFTFALASLRAVLSYWPDEMVHAGLEGGLFFGGLLTLVALVRLSVLWLLWLLWPLLAPTLLIGPFTGVQLIGDRSVALSTLAPFAYLVLLFAANALLI